MDDEVGTVLKHGTNKQHMLDKKPKSNKVSATKLSYELMHVKEKLDDSNGTTIKKDGRQDKISSSSCELRGDKKGD